MSETKGWKRISKNPDYIYRKQIAPLVRLGMDPIIANQTIARKMALSMAKKISNQK